MTPDQIRAIAAVTHEANRMYCLTLGDTSQPSWSAAPEWQVESAISGVQAVVDGTAKSPEEQHENWLSHKRADGWVYGETKDAATKTHPCMVAYADLPAEQRRKDHLFRAVVGALTGPV